MSENESEEEIKTEAPRDEREETEAEKAEREQDRKDNRIAWIRFIVLHVLVLIPIVIGVTCFIVGNRTNNNTLSFVGMLAFEVGVPVVMIILIAVVLTWKIRGIKKMQSDTEDTTVDKATAIDETQATPAPSDEGKEETLSPSEREQQAIAAVNSAHGTASRANMAEYEMDSIAEGMKHAPKWGLPVGLACFFSLFALLIVATVLLINHIFVGAIVCAAIVGVILISTFIIMAVSRARATNGDIRKAKKITEGKVKACFMVGTSTTSSGGRHGNGGTVRITGVTYKVIVSPTAKNTAHLVNSFTSTTKRSLLPLWAKSVPKS